MSIQLQYDQPNLKVVINVLDDSGKVIGGAPLSFDDADKFAAYVADFSKQARAAAVAGAPHFAEAADPKVHGSSGEPDPEVGKDGDPVGIAPGDGMEKQAAADDKKTALHQAINDVLTKHPVLAKVNGLIDGILGGGIFGGGPWNHGPWGGQPVVVAQQPVAQPVVVQQPVAQPIWGTTQPVWGGGVVQQPTVVVGGGGSSQYFPAVLLFNGRSINVNVAFSGNTFSGVFI